MQPLPVQHVQLVLFFVDEERLQFAQRVALQDELLHIHRVAGRPAVGRHDHARIFWDRGSTGARRSLCTPWSRL